MWTIEGYERTVNPDGIVTAYKIYCSKDLKSENGEGRKCRSYWYKAENIPFVPTVGVRVFVETEMFGKFEVVTDIVVM